MANERTTRVSRQLPAPPAVVYRALIDPAAVRQWKVPDGMTSEVHAFEPREGGRIRVSLSYGQPGAAGKTSAHTDTYHGRFVQLVPDRLVVEAHEFETSDPRMAGEMTARYELEPRDGGTLLRATHENVVPGVRLEDNELGWAMSLDKLARYVAAPRVLAVSRSGVHEFSKDAAPEITLVQGLGVEGDAHAGVTVKHRSRVRRDPSEPNLRQVHLLHAELFDELAGQGFEIRPGEMGENITTRGLDLLALPVDTELAIGATARVRITGLRNPCSQIDAFRPGLTAAVLGRTPAGQLVRKAGVMGVVLAGGVVRAGDSIVVHLPSAPHRPLEPV